MLVSSPRWTNAIRSSSGNALRKRFGEAGGCGTGKMPGVTNRGVALPNISQRLDGSRGQCLKEHGLLVDRARLASNGPREKAAARDLDRLVTLAPWMDLRRGPALHAGDRV